MIVPKLQKSANLSSYSAAILQTVGKKNCKNMGQETKKSHDIFYNHLNDDPQNAKLLSYKWVNKVFGKKHLDLIIDDTTIAKPYSKEIEGADYVWDSSSGKSIIGLSMITCLLTDGEKNLPIDCAPYISKKLSGHNAMTKSELALLVIRDWKDQINIKRVVADAHYSTKSFIKDLHDVGVDFLMKITATKNVKIGEKIGQLKELLKPQKNSKTGRVKGFFDGTPCYFYFVKYQEKVLYFISSRLIHRKHVASVYKTRWKIETFHRTAKQLLGLKDCQSRSYEKQIRHMFYVIEAYAYAELLRIKLKYQNVESVIHLMRSQNRNGTKLKNSSYSVRCANA